MPKRSGTIANGISTFRDVVLTAATPTAVKATPATKLAVAEKHIEEPRHSAAAIGADRGVASNDIADRTGITFHRRFLKLGPSNDAIGPRQNSQLQWDRWSAVSQRNSTAGHSSLSLIHLNTVGGGIA